MAEIFEEQTTPLKIQSLNVNKGGIISKKVTLTGGTGTLDVSASMDKIYHISGRNISNANACKIVENAGVLTITGTAGDIIQVGVIGRKIVS